MTRHVNSTFTSMTFCCRRRTDASDVSYLTPDALLRDEGLQSSALRVLQVPKVQNLCRYKPTSATNQHHRRRRRDLRSAAPDVNSPGSAVFSLSSDFLVQCSQKSKPKKTMELQSNGGAAWHWLPVGAETKAWTFYRPAARRLGRSLCSPRWSCRNMPSWHHTSCTGSRTSWRRWRSAWRRLPAKYLSVWCPRSWCGQYWWQESAPAAGRGWRSPRWHRRSFSWNQEKHEATPTSCHMVTNRRPSEPAVF